MKVKDRLSLQFTMVFAVLLMIVLTGIYFFVDHNRVKNFYGKLNERAVTVAQFYLAEDNLSKENFKQVIKKFPQSLSSESIRVYNDDFQLQFVPEGDARWDIALLKRVKDQKKVRFSDHKRQVVGIQYADNSGNFIIIVSAVDEGGYNDMHDLALIMSFFSIVSLAVIFWLGRVLARLALAPITGITKNLKNIRASSLDLRLPITDKRADEIDSLSLTINQLLEHLEQSFENQRAFIANASHELRTPITTILGEAEISLMQERGKQDYQLTLKGIIKETERLNYIVNSLMELIQSNLDTTNLQAVRIDELLWAAVDEAQPKNAAQRIKLAYNLPDDPAKFTLQGNHQLLFIAVSNVLKNALKFSNDKPVYVDVSYEINGVTVTVKDEGIGISKQDLDKIFQPFFRSSEALIYPGYGIGLSLTQNIVRLHNGTIQVSSEPGNGTEFRIHFPVY